ncbi:trypsin-like peptidase domain-containing protein [Gordonia sp. (in: high G+C Gram-positive bacteria)]|uniref:trypsin-like peptidase domain-containing protein n=1 Tax=Gordonia sp. (in: high G+C Gram-positive bacteria) TaxID=84139 RepID=UPI00260ECC1F|nr:trypsin-like peptidase domain-containing protein [Gordonia sp. (in: high G+C Gram-positive bacteria)]
MTDRGPSDAQTPHDPNPYAPDSRADLHDGHAESRPFTPYENVPGAAAPLPPMTGPQPTLPYGPGTYGPGTQGTSSPYGQEPYGTGAFGVAQPPAGPPSAPPGTGGPSSNGGGRGRGPLWIALVAILALVAGVVGGVIGVVATRDSTSSSSTDVVAAGSPSARVTTHPPAKPGSVQDVAARTLPAVVSILVTVGRESGSGSGVVLNSDGTILTNNHVVSAGGSTPAQEVLVSFSDGTVSKARVIGTDPTSDIAVIKTEKTGLTPIPIGTSDNLSVGQDVIAIGSPLGLEGTVTTGIISALNRPVSTSGADGSTESVIDAIQTDAAINPGNSGGALVNASGALIGINTAIATLGASEGSSGSIGLGFAIPIDQAMRVANQLIKGEKVTRASLGVNVRPSADATQPGALVASVVRGGSAAQAGIPEGALITAVDDRKIPSSEALVASIRSHAPGDTVKITYTDRGRQQTATVKLGSS